VGAKTYFVIQHPDLFWENPVGVFFSLAGSGWFGGFLLCLLLFILYFRMKRLPFLHFADVLIPAVPLGIIFGRIGCFLSGDGCYGVPTDLPWGMRFPDGVVPTLLTVHPTSLYEVLANTVIFMCLIKLNKYKPADGSVMAIYFILSSIARFLVEFIRLSPIVLWGLTAPQMISICLFAIGCLLFNLRYFHCHNQQTKKGERYAHKKLSFC
jgi:phosphatidylglycerol:prolipoprotein diacylglycerol transferase